jgi:nitrogen fixation NifU-like protein
MDDLYREHILDHAENPRCQGRLPHPTHTGVYGNRSCGDEIGLDLEITAGQIAAVRWRGEGCVISLAGASVLAEKIERLPVEEVLAWDDEQVLERLGLPDVSYARRQCALTFINAVRHVLKEAE